MVTERLTGVVRAGRKPAKRAEPRPDESRLIEALRRREGRTCLRFISQNHAVMVRLALPYVGSPELAEDVAQEAWAALMQGLDSFEGRSSLRSWLFGILLNRARLLGAREGRSTAASQLVGEVGEPSMDFLDRLFHGRDHPDCGRWAIPPRRWSFNPEDELLARERRRRIDQAAGSLPEAQRVVFALRVIEGWKTDEVAELLERTSNWVRVVLHRARMHIREVLEEQLGGVDL